MALGNVLIVDDSDVVTDDFSEAFGKAGLDVVTAASGQEALNTLVYQQFDFVVLDFNMPGMNGLQFLEKAKEKGYLTTTPVLMCTTERSEEAKTQGRKLGVMGWVVKPVNLEKLVSVVISTIEKTKQAQ